MMALAPCSGDQFPNTISTIQKRDPDAAVITNGFTVNEPSVFADIDDVTDWLRKLGFLMKGRPGMHVAVWLLPLTLLFSVCLIPLPYDDTIPSTAEQTVIQETEDEHSKKAKVT